MRHSHLLLSSVAATLISATEIKRQNAETTSAFPISQITPSPTTLECFSTSLKTTSQCSVTRGITLTCLPSVATITTCKASNRCYKNSNNEDACVLRNDTVAPAGIAFAVIVPIIIIVIAATLLTQRIKEKRKRRQAADDRLRGVHMDMRGSRKVEVTFVERRGGRRGDDDDFPLVDYGDSQYDIPPAYTESDRTSAASSAQNRHGMNDRTQT